MSQKNRVHQQNKLQLNLPLNTSTAANVANRVFDLAYRRAIAKTLAGFLAVSALGASVTHAHGDFHASPMITWAPSSTEPLTITQSPLLSTKVSTEPLERPSGQPILADLTDLKYLKIPIFAQDLVSDVGLAFVTNQMISALQTHSHTLGKCGGFEALPSNRPTEEYLQSMRYLQRITKRDLASAQLPTRRLQVRKKDTVAQAVAQVQENNLRDMVQWFSSFKTRNDRSANANDHLNQLKEKIEKMAATSKLTNIRVELINHNATKQQSLRVTLPGRLRPQEIVVIGGHHDSVNLSWMGDKTAPGADDNASGSSNLYEVLRILLAQQQLERTVEIMWYGGEESGLLGSAEIAKAYKKANADVVGVMQLDMTAFPGSGEMTIANMTDFTNPWLQNFMKEINGNYVGMNILDDTCGYGCSDHASWYRQGYATVIPFESKMATMNPNIHTAKDTLSPALNFKHAAAIAKLSLAFVIELADSNLRPQ